MNHELLKTVIMDQHVVIRESVISPRSYDFEPNANYVLVGLRRAGKSTLMHRRVQQLVASGVDWNRIIYINFEDERLAEMQAADLNDIIAVQSELSTEKGYYFFDELQNIPGWEKFARRMADSKEHVWITGSNARMLSREITTVLGGRYLQKYIQPYSFIEYLDALNIQHTEAQLLSTRSRGQIAAAMQQYLQDGGFPETLQYNNRREYISSVYQKILLGDIMTRNNLRNDHALRLLIKKIAETVMNEVSYSKLHGTLKAIGLSISKDSVIDYIGYAQDAYLLFALRNYVAAFSERESTPKYYFSDNGLLNLFLINKRNALLQNLTAIELCRRYPNQVFYLRSTQTGIDVDFIVPQVGLAIQVCDSLNEQSFDRQTGNLIKLSRNMTDITRFIIVTPDERKTLNLNDVTIEVMPIDQFALLTNH